MSTSIGFVGLGRMGFPMVRNLLKSGKTAIACEKEQAIRATCTNVRGLHLASSPAEVIEGADIVFTCLPSTDAIREVYLGKDGVCVGGSSSKLVCELSTTTSLIAKPPLFAVTPTNLSPHHPCHIRRKPSDPRHEPLDSPAGLKGSSG